MTVPARELLGEDLAAVTRGARLVRGLGRSYGDAPLPSRGESTVVGSTLADRILRFDRETGLLRAEAGASLVDVNRVLLRAGFFSPVVPGTQFVTLGGMVAADVHGKNHHVAGTFGRHVTALRLRLADDSIAEVTRDSHPELFRATVGGMGWTGHILEVEFRAERVPSPWLVSEGRRARDIDHFLELLAAEAARWPFTVGWIDCVSGGSRLGRGILWCGRWAEAAEAPLGFPAERPRLTVPLDLPSWAISRPLTRLGSAVIFHGSSLRRKVVTPEKFFFPLDMVLRWNRLYGRRGMAQFQCVLPEKDSPGATRRFLEALARRGGASVLCVIKDCGEAGEGLLSFPFRGVSVAVDVPMRDDTQGLIDELARVTREEGGRIYLAKDGWVRRDDLRAMEGARLDAFLDVKRRYDPSFRLRSAQFDRLLDPPAKEGVP
jgi:decaprenylphospho-beta-D-ribofuranose 2-oxidase